MLSFQSSGGERPWALMVVAMLVVALGSACSSTTTKSNGGTTASTSGAGAITTRAPASAPTTSPPTTVALTPLPITLTNADFQHGFSQDLQLGGGVYTLTLTSNRPGPGIGADVYESCGEGVGKGIVAGSSLYLGKGETTDMGPTKSLKAGCYQLFLVNLSSATVTVKLAR
jgi:hypothetical protein